MLLGGEEVASLEKAEVKMERSEVCKVPVTLEMVLMRKLDVLDIVVADVEMLWQGP